MSEWDNEPISARWVKMKFKTIDGQIAKLLLPVLNGRTPFGVTPEEFLPMMLNTFEAMVTGAFRQFPTSTPTMVNGDCSIMGVDIPGNIQRKVSPLVWKKWQIKKEYEAVFNTPYSNVSQDASPSVPIV